MTLDTSALYLEILKRHFDPKKFLDLDSCDRILNALFLVDNSIHPTHESKLEKWSAKNRKVDSAEKFKMKNVRSSDYLDNFRVLYSEDSAFKKEATVYLKKIISNIKEKDSKIKQRSDELKILLKLTDEDILVIHSLVIMKRAGGKLARLPAIVNRPQYEYDIIRESYVSRDKISCFIGDSGFTVSSILPSQSILLRSGLIERGRFNSYAISERLYNYFTDINSDISTIHNLEVKSGPFFPLESFAVGKDELKLCKSLFRMDQPSSILFLGVPGAGKTQLAMSLADHLGLKAYFIPTKEVEGEDGLSLRKMSLSVATSCVHYSTGIVVLDEADSIVNTADNPFRMMNSTMGDQKSWFNDLMDKNESKLIVISNKNTMDSSTLRRFSLIVQFKALDEQQKIVMLQNTLNENNLSDLLNSEEQAMLVKNSSISQGIIALALKNSNSIATNVEDKKEVFLKIISNKQEFESGSKLSLSKKESFIDPAGFNLSTDLSIIEKKVAYFLNDEVRGRFKPEQMTMLFYGVSGGGKTTFAEYLANKFNRNLISISSSSLLSKYVGETEQKIREIFEQANTKKSFLFIDEIEGLISQRQEQDRKFELTRVNEFLFSMEQHKGLFMAATNLPGLLDKAFERRFSEKLEFKAPTLESRVKLVQKYFSDQLVIEDSELTALLKSLDGLCAGHVKAVKNSLAFEDKITADVLFDKLKDSVGPQKPRIGLGL